MTMIDDGLLYCPKCGSSVSIKYDIEYGNYIGYFKCNTCNWVGGDSELLTYEEKINITRSKRLKEILK